MSVRIEGLTAWITGGGSGLGAALAVELAERGANIVVSGRRLDRLEAVCHKVESLGTEAFAVVCDVREDAQVGVAVNDIVDRFGRLDIAIANAGFGVTGSFGGVSFDQWKNQMDTNVLGVVSTLQHAMPHIRESRGRLAVVSSILGKLSMPKSAPYSASKYALIGLCRSLQQELHGTGVSLTNILPGLVFSEIGLVDNNGIYHSERSDRRNRTLMWSPEKAADVMATAIIRRKREVTFTGHGRVGGFVGQHAPGLVHWVMTHAPIG